MADWFDPGPFVPEPLTERQREFLAVTLKYQPDRLLDLLTIEERVGVELMGAEEWLTILSKWDATQLISSLKDADVAEKVRDRPVKPVREATIREKASAHRRKWWDTGR